MLPAVKLLAAVLKTTPAVVNWVAGGSLMILILKIILLNYIPEQFPYAYDLGLLVENILAATVAAYIFFLISYQVPLVVERRKVGPTIAMLIDAVVQHVVEFLCEVNRTLNSSTLPQPVTLKVVTQLFAKIAPNGPAPRISMATHVPLSWLAYMVEEDTLYHDYLDQLWRYARFIDAELAALMDYIRFSRHATMMKLMREHHVATSLPLSNPDMSIFAEPYFQCYQLALRLQRYCTAFRSTYDVSVNYGT